MDEYTAGVFANRDEPLPLLTVTLSDADASSSEAEKEGRRRRLRNSISPSRLKEKIQDLGAGHVERLVNMPEGSQSLQDRLFAKILQQVIPSEDVDSSGEPVVDRRSSKYVRRPAFSLPLMTNNFRRFNARIGIVFVFQNNLIRLFTWRTTTHTLSFLAVYTFVCLDPYLLVVLPLATILLFIMVPAFITRHPPPPPSVSTSSITPYSEYTYSGPALAPAGIIRPAAETSKDFFRNMRDLQNSMADFTTIHDALNALITPTTNFSNEIRSSTLFLFLSILTTVLFISAHIFPWRFIFLAAGYALTISGHPTAQIWLMRLQRRAEKEAATLTSSASTSASASSTPASQTLPRSLLASILPIPATMKSKITTLSQISLDSAPETREVEIFELQHRPLPSTFSNSTPPEWTHYLFTPSPFDPLSPSRIAGERPKGTRFFEDVQPPPGWAWEGKKWSLDLEAGEWVAERLVVGVEYDVFAAAELDDASEKKDQPSAAAGGEFGGWVWDLPPVYGGTRDEEVWLAYGDYSLDAEAAKEKQQRGLESDKGKDKDKDKKSHKKVLSRDWEESTRWTGSGRTGEWRRRRWVRVVRRVGLGDVSTTNREQAAPSKK